MCINRLRGIDLLLDNFYIKVWYILKQEGCPSSVNSFFVSCRGPV